MKYPFPQAIRPLTFHIIPGLHRIPDSHYYKELYTLYPKASWLKFLSIEQPTLPLEKVACSLLLCLTRLYRGLWNNGWELHHRAQPVVMSRDDC